MGEIHGVYLSVHGCFHMQTADEAAIFSGVEYRGEGKPDQKFKP